jgi:uncharacterized membrane protein
MLARFLILASFVVATWPGALAAQDAIYVLDYRPADGCPAGARFGDEVAARLGYAPFADDGEPVRVRIMRSEDGGAALYVGALAVGREPGRAFESGDCADLVGTMAAALAVRIDDASAPVDREPSASHAAGVAEDERDDGRARLRILADEERSLTLHREAMRIAGYDIAAYDPICTAPCEVEMALGSHRFAISQGTGAALALSEPTRIDGDTTLRLNYESREDMRIAGGVWWGVGAVLGIVLTVLGGVTGVTPLLAVGGPLAGASVIGGLILVFHGDLVRIEIE